MATTCKHGTYIGTPSGPDYLCGACEDGATNTTDTIPPAHLDMVLNVYLPKLRTQHRRFVKWLQACDAWNNGGPAPSLRLMPSKTYKHNMYDNAGQVRRLLQIDLPSPRSLDEIATLIQTATAML